MSYKVEILKGALKQLKKLPPEVRERIQIKIDNLTIEPRPNGVIKIQGKENTYRIKISDYRVLYDIFDDVLLISVVKVDHRSDVYKDKS